MDESEPVTMTSSASILVAIVADFSSGGGVGSDMGRKSGQVGDMESRGALETRGCSKAADGDCVDEPIRYESLNRRSGRPTTGSPRDRQFWRWISRRSYVFFNRADQYCSKFHGN